MTSFLIKNHKIVAIVFLFLSLTYFVRQNIYLKHENERVIDNYENALQMDSLKVAIFKINSAHELEQIINQNKSLQNLVSKSEIKTKRIEGLYYQQQTYLDSVKKTMDVTGLVSDIRNNTPSFKNWVDSTSCATIKGNVMYNNDSLSVNVTSKEFNNNVVLIKHEGKRKPVKWLFNLRLGKRNIEFTPETECGDVKVTVVEK